jgi:predicted nucleic acid-binding protein
MGVGSVVAATTVAIVTTTLDRETIQVMSAADDAQAMFGMFPLILQRIHDAGDLDEKWPFIQSVWFNPDPLPRPVIDGLMAVLGLRCREEYCFVIHTMQFMAAGADRVAVQDLWQHFKIPELVPDHERWTKIVGLTWLSFDDAPHAALAKHAVQSLCTPEEYAKLLDVIALYELTSHYTVRYQIKPQDEPGLAMIPAHLHGLIPEFVEFYTRLREEDPGERPVCTTCASCQKVRSKSDRTWYPRETVVELLPADVLYSHGLCNPCADAYAA